MFQGANLYATKITTAGVDTGSFNFNGGGTSIVSGTIGTDANKFNSITLTNNTTVKFTDDVISKLLQLVVILPYKLPMIILQILSKLMLRVIQVHYNLLILRIFL